MKSMHLFIRFLIPLVLLVLACNAESYVDVTPDVVAEDVEDPIKPTPPGTPTPEVRATIVADLTATALARQVTPTATRGIRPTPTTSIGPLPLTGELEEGVTASGRLNGGQRDRWTFAAGAGDIVTLVVTPLDDSLDVVVNLLDENGAPVLGGAVDDSLGEERLEDVPLARSGIYTVLISGFADSIGRYELTLTFDDSDAARVEPGELELDAEVTAELTGSDSAVWRFSAAAGTYVDITTVPISDDLDVVVDVLDAGGSSILPDGPVDQAVNIEFIRLLPLTAGGEYDIVISGYAGSTGMYELRLATAFPGVPNIMVRANVSLDEADESDSYPFTAQAGSTVRAIIGPSAEIDAVLGVYQGTTNLRLDEVDRITVGFEEITFVVPESGAYFFTVHGYEGDTGAYQIWLVGDYQTRFELTGGEQITGRFDNHSQVEFFLRGAAGDTFTIDAGGDELTDLILRILDDDGAILAEVDETLTGDAESLTFTFDDDGAVTIQLDSLLAGGDAFELSVTRE